MNDIKFKDSDGCALTLDSYVSCTKRGDPDDWAFVLLTKDPDADRHIHLVGLTYEQAKNLAVFLVEELAK